MARKAYTFIEYTFAEQYVSETEHPVAVLKKLLNDYIAETNDKNSKIARDFVFDSVKPYTWSGNKGAFSIEFINERTRQTFFKARENFVAWLATKGIEVSHNISCDVPYELFGMKTTDNKFGPIHAEKLKEYFFETLPTDRGFTVE